MDMAKVIDEAKAKLGVESDYALAKETGILKQRISAYRNGSQTPDTYACAKLAEILGIDPFKLLAQVEAATEKNEARRNYWRALSQKVGAGVTVCFLALVGAEINANAVPARAEDAKTRTILVHDAVIFRS